MRYFEVRACLYYVKLILVNFYKYFEKRTDRKDMTGFKPVEVARSWSCKMSLKL